MIVVDASIIVEVLLQTQLSKKIWDRILTPEQEMCTPHLLDVEVTQVLRRYSARPEVDHNRMREALADFLEFPLIRYPHEFLLPRIWELRQAMTAYDGAYVALAESLECPLLTCDLRLAQSSGHFAHIEGIAGTA